MTTAALPAEPVSFALPQALEALEPPEARGLARDEVRLLVSRGDDIVHARFTHLAEFLRAGDLVVVNTSATINAALRATRETGEAIELHFSQRSTDDQWIVELRRRAARGTRPLLDARPGEILRLPENGRAALLTPYSTGGDDAGAKRGTRLWLAKISVPSGVERYLAEHGFPIRYPYVPKRWPLPYYQTIFARDPGSAEMPSAGRPFSVRVVQTLARAGIDVAPILLHTGVSSLEEHELPFPERFCVSALTARRVNETRLRGGRVVAVGTTSVRAIESVATPDGRVAAGGGWTDVVVNPERGLFIVDALLTGFHEPRASHLAMLEALAGREHVERAYAAAIDEGYLWHEFGDVHLILPDHRQPFLVG